MYSVGSLLRGENLARRRLLWKGINVARITDDRKIFVFTGGAMGPNAIASFIDFCRPGPWVVAILGVSMALQHPSAQTQTDDSKCREPRH